MALLNRVSSISKIKKCFCPCNPIYLCIPSNSDSTRCLLDLHLVSIIKKMFVYLLLKLRRMSSLHLFLSITFYSRSTDNQTKRKQKWYQQMNQSFQNAMRVVTGSCGRIFMAATYGGWSLVLSHLASIYLKTFYMQSTLVGTV